MRKKIISMFLVAFMATSFISAYASPVDGGDNSGGGSGGGTVSGSTWRESQSGYRITVVDDNKQVVATVVDFLFSEPGTDLPFGDGDKYWYTNSRFTGLSNDINGYRYDTFQELKDAKQINDVPQFPIYSQSGKLHAGGEYFKEWFLNGNFGMDITNVNRKPEYTPSDEKKVETGTSRPVSSTPNYQSSGSGPTGYDKKVDTMGRYDGSAMITNTSTRQSKFNQSMVIVADQGYLASANASAASAVRSARVMWKRESGNIKDGNYSSLLVKISNAIVANAEYYGRTIAEQNYIVAKALNEFLGYGKTPSNTAISSRPTSSNEIYLDRIPASKVISPEYYIDEIMNSMSGGKYNFQFNGTGIDNMSGVNSTNDPLEVIQENNFYITVEPVFWLKPALSKKVGNKYVKTNERSHYVYGTVANFVDYYNSLGWNRAGFYESLTNTIGWSSMYMGNDWNDSNGKTILKGVKLGDTMSAGLQTNSAIKGFLNAGYAVGTHVYRTSQEDIQVTGFTNWDTPSRAPDPVSLRTRTGWNKEYNIVKYYEEYENGKLIHRYEPLYRGANPPKIEIVSELYFKVEDWFISSSSVASGAPAEYESAKGKYGSKRGGKTTVTVKLEDHKISGGTHTNEKTLFVKLVSRNEGGSVPDGSIVVGESHISIQVNTSNSSIKDWGLRSYSLPVFGKTVDYRMSNVGPVDEKLEATKGGKFSSTIENGTLKGNGGKLDKINYKTVVWRGNDEPTLASYKVSGTDSIRSLIGRYGSSPVTDRGNNGQYTKKLDIELSPRDSVGLTEDEKAKIEGMKYASDVVVKVYRGNRDAKSEGAETKTGELNYPANVVGGTSNYSTGKMIQQATRLQFYPYLRMTYQDNTSQTPKDTYVTSQWNSVLIPNDYVEVGWVNSNESESLAVDSTQWSIHKRAVDGGQSWNGHNQVLPGGAIYTVSPQSDTVVGLTTWQTIMTGAERDNLSVEIPPNEYTVAKATVEHDGFVAEAKETLDNLGITQWINADPNAQFAWSNNGRRLKVSAGESLSPLGLGGTVSADAKYQLNQGDEEPASLDITGEAKNQNVYYKVFSDTSGDIYLAKSVGDLAKLEKVNGLKLSESGVTVTTLFARNVKASDAKALLTGEAKELNERTMLITNFVKALERNSGDDKTASWASIDGKWYNEAWDGVYVVRQQTNLKIGMDSPKSRTLALDPNLTPRSSGKADIMMKAFVSQYRTEASSNTDIARLKGPGYVGTFKGEDVRLMNMGDIFRSKKFYIPNALVTDSY